MFYFEDRSGKAAVVPEDCETKSVGLGSNCDGIVEEHSFKSKVSNKSEGHAVQVHVKSTSREVPQTRQKHGRYNVGSASSYQILQLLDREELEKTAEKSFRSGSLSSVGHLDSPFVCCVSNSL